MAIKAPRGDEGKRAQSRNHNFIAAVAPVRQGCVEPHSNWLPVLIVVLLVAQSAIGRPWGIPVLTTSSINPSIGLVVTRTLVPC
jgi:hypothetical protein